MSISTHIPAIPQIASNLITDQAKSWQPGQILIAKAEVGGDTQSKVLLRIGRLLLEAKTPIPLKTGDNVTLLVKQAGDLPILKILSKPNIQQIAANKLLNIIGQQSNVKSLIENSSKLLSNPALSNPIRQQLQTLVNSLPKLSQLSNPHELRSLIRNNSVFLESSLLHQNRILPEQNLKLQILQLSQQLKLDTYTLTRTETTGTGSPGTLQQLLTRFTEGRINAHQLIQLFSSSLPTNQQHSLISSINNSAKLIPPTDFHSVITQFLTIINTQNNAAQLTAQIKQILEKLILMQDLKGLLDNTLAKITGQQLAPLTRDTEQSTLLLFDILFRDHKTLHLVEFNLEHTKPTKDKNSHDWSVTIKFNFEELGPMQAEIKLTENMITTLFQAEYPQTAEMIRKNLGLLEDSLLKAGFTISSLGILNKKIAVKPVLPVEIPLLDVKV